MGCISVRQQGDAIELASEEPAALAPDTKSTASSASVISDGRTNGKDATGGATTPTPEPAPGAQWPCRISSLAGELCELTVTLETDLLDLKQNVRVKTRVPEKMQRIVHGLHEVRSTAEFHDLLRQAGSDGIDLHLIKRSDEQLKWQAELAQLAQYQAYEAGTWLSTAPDAAQSDPDIVMMAVRLEGTALQHAAPYLTADRKTVLAAVSQNGRALEFVDDDLKEDREVVLIAVRQQGKSLQFASESMRADRECVLAAVRHRPEAAAYASSELQQDAEVLAAAYGDQPQT